MNGGQNRLSRIELTLEDQFSLVSGPAMGFRGKLSSDSDSPWSITYCSPVPGAKLCFLVRIQKNNKLEVILTTNLLI